MYNIIHVHAQFVEHQPRNLVVSPVQDSSSTSDVHVLSYFVFYRDVPSLNYITRSDSQTKNVQSREYDMDNNNNNR